jgi:hypothetical protein
MQVFTAAATVTGHACYLSCSLFVPQDESEETLMLLLISESIVSILVNSICHLPDN